MTLRRRLTPALAVPLVIPLAAGLVVVTVLAVHGLARTDGDAGAPATSASADTVESATDTEEPTVPTTSTRKTRPRLVFRHTGIDAHLGTVASLPLADPRGRRTFTAVVCDRVDATPVAVSCLRTERGVRTRFEQVLLDADWSVTETVPLAGSPSRTRLSPDGTLVASTVFVSGHSYQQTGYSTATEIREVDGPALGNLESFRLVVDGQANDAEDRNVWGVSFLDDTTFYATAATGGLTYLVRGDLAERTLTALRENAECPSISPDGTQVAYKIDGLGAGTHWSWAVLDLATGRERVLRGETRGVNDQATWLDDDTLLYGMPRPDRPGVTDVWSLDTRAQARPRLFVERAWSPSVVRP